MLSLGVFFLALFISFFGMIPAGLINSSVMLRALREGIKPSMYVALGAVVVECAHMIIGIKIIDLLLEEGTLFNVLRWISVAIFLVFSIYFYSKKDQKSRQIETQKYSSPFVEGFVISNLNILAIPFWAFFATWIETSGMVDRAWDFWPEIIFGAGLGSMGTLYLYARMAGVLDKRFDWFQDRINLILAGVFFFLAVFTLIRLL